MNYLVEGVMKQSEEAYKILVIEDDKDMRELLDNTLSSSSKLRLKVDSVPSAEDAFANSVLTHYSLVVTDFKLPGMNGHDFIENFRKEPVNKKTPIIFLSGFMQELDSSIPSSFYDNVVFLDKPFDPLHFLTRAEFLIKTNSIISSGNA